MRKEFIKPLNERQTPVLFGFVQSCLGLGVNHRRNGCTGDDRGTALIELQQRPSIRKVRFRGLGNKTQRVVAPFVSVGGFRFLTAKYKCFSN